MLYGLIAFQSTVNVKTCKRFCLVLSFILKTVFPIHFSIDLLDRPLEFAISLYKLLSHVTVSCLLWLAIETRGCIYL